MENLHFSVVALAILLVVLGIAFGWPIAARTYGAFFVIGNLLTLPATIMMLAAPKKATDPWWQQLGMSIYTVVGIAPATPIWFVKESIWPSYRSPDGYNNDGSPYYDDDPASKKE